MELEKMSTNLDLQKYFEPLEAIHNREYPIPECELRTIVEQSMQGLSIKTNKLEEIREEVEQRLHRNINNFLFYYQTLLKKNVSPIEVVRGYFPRDEKMLVECYYLSDISSDYEIGGWRNFEEVPELDWNNFWIYFSFDYFSRGWDEQQMLNFIRESLIDEHKEIFMGRFRKKELLIGDIKFGLSKFKSYLRQSDSLFNSGLVAKLSEEEIEKARIELADRNILGYVDLQGKEIKPCKTSFEAWEEFKEENHGLFHDLVEMHRGVGKGYRNLTNNDLYLVDKAFILLKMKGFSKYPDLSA